jgi:hypothetical protein
MVSVGQTTESILTSSIVMMDANFNTICLAGVKPPEILDYSGGERADCGVLGCDNV